MNRLSNFTSFLVKHYNDIMLHFAFLMWFVLASFFSQERLFSDAGYYLAKVVDYQCFWTELNRYIIIFSQWLPLLLVYIKADMAWVIWGYSVGHVLFFYGCYLVARLGFGHRYAGWIFILLQTVGISYGFCTPGFEYYYVAAFLVLWLLMLQQNHYTPLRIVGQLFLLFFMVTGYRAVVIFVGSALLVHCWSHGFKHWKYYLGIGTFILACLLFKKWGSTDYEQEKIAWILHLVLEHHFTLDYWWELAQYYGQYYKTTWLLIAINLVLLLANKRYVLSVGYVLGVLLVQYLVVLSHIDLVHTRYQEQCYFPLILVAVLPLLATISFVKPKYKKFIFSAFFVLIISQFIGIAIQIKPYTERVALMHRLIAVGRQQGKQKLIVAEDTNPLIADMTFGLGIETRLLSALQPDRQTVQVIRTNDWQYLENLGNNPLRDSSHYLHTFKGFYDRKDSIYLHQNRNQTYFPNFEPSHYYWQTEKIKPLENLAILKGKVQLTATPRHRYRVSKAYLIPIAIQNNSSIDLPSQQLKIAYHWYQAEEVTAWEGSRTALEIDLPSHSQYAQPMLIQMPDKKGRYRLQLDMVAEGIDWLGDQPSYEIDVQ